MRELFFDKLIEGYGENLYHIDTEVKNNTNEPSQIFLKVFDAQKKLILKMEITHDEHLMLLFLMKHEYQMKDYYSTAFGFEIR